MATEGEQIIWKIHLRMITLGTLRFVQVTTCHANLLNQKQDMSHKQANFQNILFCSCLLSGRITTAINTANDYTDDVLQNGFGTNPVWLIREKVMSASRNNLLVHHILIFLFSNRFVAICLHHTNHKQQCPCP